ncbi:MAG: hypothetical protein WCR67_04860 [Bacilli bacterium]
MKKSLILMSALAVLASSAGLASCNTTTSTSTSVETSVSVSTGDSTSTSTSTTPSISVSAIGVNFTSKVSEVEVGSSITIRAAAVNLDGSDLENDYINFSTDDEDERYLTLPDTITNTNSIKVTGRRTGTVVITATSVADRTVSATITITVKTKLSALKSVINTVNDLTNYTFVSTYTDNDGEEAEYGRVERTSTTLLQTVVNADGESVSPFTAEGLGIAKDGYAIYLEKDSNGAYTGNERLTCGSGFLTASNFAGFGDSTSSPNDTQTIFTSFAGLNPSWFTSTKSSDNTYEIEGTSDDVNSALAEFTLWSMMDPISLYNYISAGTSNFVDLAALAETTIDVLTNSTIKVTLTVGDVTLTGSLTEVGTTEAPEAAAAYLAATASVAPALSATMDKIRNCYTSGVYAKSNVGYVTVGSSQKTITWWTYITENYYFHYYDAAFISGYEESGSAWEDDGNGHALIGEGYVKKSDGMHSVVVYDGGKDTEGADVADTVIIDSAVVSETDADTTIDDIVAAVNYGDDTLINLIDNSAFLYSVGSTAEAPFDSLSTSYYYSNSSSDTSWNALAAYFIGQNYSYYPAKFTSAEYIVGVAPVYSEADSSVVEEVKYLFACGNNDTGWYVFDDYSTKEHGTAKAPDGIDALILAAIAA